MITHSTYHYNNPLVITAAVYLFLAFTKLPIKKSQFINRIAEGAISIYIIHLNYLVFPEFKKFFQLVYSFFPDGAFVAVSIPLVFVFAAVCLMIDRIRVYVWGWSQSLFLKAYESIVCKD